MDGNGGKKLYRTYEEAERAAKSLRTRLNENFQPVRTDGGWVVGGVHLKNKTPYKRVRDFADIRALFDDLADSVSDADVAEYANHIAAESATAKISAVNGNGESWTLMSWETKTGRQLGMNNDTNYLTLTVQRESQTLQIQMGGAFSRHIPLISAQAESLCGRTIVWHTWNSPRDPAKWERSKWFYMIEPADT